MYVFLEQLNRVKRFLNRIENQNRKFEDYQDDLWSFFQNCWHLKDWVKNDPEISEEVKSQVNIFAHKNQYLKTCQGLCNRTKHLEVYNTQNAANFGDNEPYIFEIDSLDNNRIIGKTFWNTTIMHTDGTKERALEVAQEAVCAWEEFFIDNGIDIYAKSKK